METRKETCLNCGNIVIGEFQPSLTRKTLTTAVKKVRMKTAVGSVVPGFGNVTVWIFGSAADSFACDAYEDEDGWSELSPDRSPDESDEDYSDRMDGIYG